MKHLRRVSRERLAIWKSRRGNPCRPTFGRPPPPLLLFSLSCFFFFWLKRRPVIRAARADHRRNKERPRNIFQPEIEIDKAIRRPPLLINVR